MAREPASQGAVARRLALVIGFLLTAGCRALTADPPDGSFDGPIYPGVEVPRAEVTLVDMRSGAEVLPPHQDAAPDEGPLVDAPDVDAAVDMPVDAPPMEVLPGCVAVAEICDGKDNDCDGVVDDGLSMACSSACGSGTKSCSNGVWSNCSARLPSAETCDNQDNDCNGKVDDNVTRDCATTCEPGKETCSGGRWGACSAKKPSNSDVSSCGSACLRCNSAPVNGTPVCMEGHCDYACNQPGLKSKCNGQCTQCCGADASTCGTGSIWSCVNNQCSCSGMTCGGECRVPTRGCMALIRSQGPDDCVSNVATVGCGPNGPYSDDTTCRVGIIRRILVTSPAACTRPMLDEMGRAGCRQYIDNNRQPGFDPTKPIYVSYGLEVFDSNGRIDYNAGSTIADTSCAALGVAGSAP